MSRPVWFIIGLILGVVVLAPLGVYLLARFGGIAMATTAAPLPLEETIAKTALRANLKDAQNLKDPLPPDDPNMLDGVRVYKDNCAGCHGFPDRPKTSVAQGEFPAPPQLFDPAEWVTDDPEGVTYWKVSHGIRLSGMPGFANSLSEDQRWQVTMLVAHADKPSGAVKNALVNASIGCREPQSEVSGELKSGTGAPRE